MKKKYLYIAAFVSVIVVVFYTIVGANSTGATYGVCGAPDDQIPGTSCGYSGGCHNFTPITDNDALKITLVDQSTSQPVTSYQIGKKYTVKIELTYRSLVTCGFESEIELPNTPYTHMGKLAAGTRSQIATGPKSSQYATHYNSLKTSAHYGMWQYTWTAPTTYSGDLIIYAAGNSANGDGNVYGDTIFNAQMRITHNASIDNKILDVSKVSVYPNPAKENFTLNCSLIQEENTTIDLYDFKGQQIKAIQSGILPQGDNKISADIRGLPAGLYFVKINAGGESAVEKVMIN